MITIDVRLQFMLTNFFILRTKRAWHPNVQKKKYYSEVLGTPLQLRVTTAAMRCIDKAGGLDAYIYHTPNHKLNSKLGVALKQRMVAIINKYPEIKAPRKAKRLPRPPRSLQTLQNVDKTSTKQIASSI